MQGLRQLHRLIEATAHVAPSMQWHGQDCVNVGRQERGRLQQQIAESWLIKEFAVKLEGLYRRIDWK